MNSSKRKINKTLTFDLETEHKKQEEDLSDFTFQIGTMLFLGYPQSEGGAETIEVSLSVDSIVDSGLTMRKNGNRWDIQGCPITTTAASALVLIWS